MTDQEPLLAAIRANPADDTVRLIYADWLEEYGDAKDRKWAAMIRHQVALVRVPHNHRPGKKGPCPRCVLEKENRSLVGWANWNLVPPTLDGRCRFDRGFVSLVAAPARAWCRTFNSAADATPGWEAAWEARGTGCTRPLAVKPTLVLAADRGTHSPGLGASLNHFGDAHVVGLPTALRYAVRDYAPGGRYAPEGAEGGMLQFYDGDWDGWVLDSIVGRDWQGRLLWPIVPTPVPVTQA